MELPGVRLSFCCLVLVVCVVTVLNNLLLPKETEISRLRKNAYRYCVQQRQSVDFFRLERRELPSSARVGSANGTAGGGFRTVDEGDEQLTDLLKQKCNDSFPVPPIVHYVWLGRHGMKFHQYVSVLGASRYLRPCFILFHGDAMPEGKWWRLLLTNVTNIVFVRCAPPTHIYGQRLAAVEHQADVLRLEVLIKHGGIYLDTDTYAIRSFDSLRNSKVTLGRESHKSVSNSVIVAMKDASFLKMWYLAYSSYNGGSWAENSVWMAGRLSRIVRRIVDVRNTGLVLLGENFTDVYQKDLLWDEDTYSVHLYARLFPRTDFEIDDVKTMRTSFGALSRHILFGSREVKWKN